MTDRQTDRQTEATECITTAAFLVVTSTKSPQLTLQGSMYRQLGIIRYMPVNYW